MKKLTTEEVYGWSGAAIILLLLLLLLSFVYLTAEPKPQEEGILALFEEAANDFEEMGVSNPDDGTDVASEAASEAPDVPQIPDQQAVAPPEAGTPTPASPTPPANAPLTDTDPVPIAAPTPSPEELAEQRRQAEAEAKRQKEAENQKKINAQVAAALAGGKGTGTSTSPTLNTGSGTAAAGETPGVSINLNGRTRMGNLQSPVYSAQEEGIVVVNITVDPQGNVINATVRPGTTISDPQMRNSSIDAAKRTKFNAIKSGENATGTITYRFKLK
ncbi:cell envelope biogenesis protein TonB [Bacteroidia bacterium]|nr:cell envelope biogenesis protein TonB [Bacteroidia bacterium]